jgi:cytosine/adenosine deaminase-related metal-dependent hydrolase|tara:strand:+ start:545 stop:1888 length:1344 start_codon:yes stop_codon:yes gene_type:complete
LTDTLIQNARLVLTMDATRRAITAGDVLLRDGVIAAVGVDFPSDGCSVVNAEGCLVTPGLVNTHHHLYQTMTRAVPGAQDAALFGWLQTLYPIWAAMRPDDFFTSAQVGMVELLLSGCTTTADHLYLYPNGARLEDTIHAAQEIGMRFHPTRGAMSIGESDGGLPPDHLVEREAAILDDMIRVIDAFHDASHGSMLRVGVAPCSPFSVSRELMRDAAVLARDKSVMMHTHLAENNEDIAYSLERFGMRPGQYAEELGWTGPDVWHAHCVKLNPQEIALFARTQTGVAHCPCSNCRLASGIAPVRAMRDAGVPVGLGVDGSASNDSGNLMAEARQTMLLQRVAYGAGAMSPGEALEIATRGGAQILGRDDCGSLEVGKCADVVIWDMEDVSAAGNWDPAAILLAGPSLARDVFVNGKQVVAEGHITTLDQRALAARQNQQMRALQERV